MSWEQPGCSNSELCVAEELTKSASIMRWFLHPKKQVKHSQLRAAHLHSVNVPAEGLNKTFLSCSFPATSLCLTYTWSLTSVGTQGLHCSSWKHHLIHARGFLCVNRMVDWGIKFSKNSLYSWCRKKEKSLNTHVWKTKQIKPKTP